MNRHPGDPGVAPDWCIHFRSMAQHNTCEAGIDYTVLNGGTDYRRMNRLPCFIKNDDKSKQRVDCEHFSAPTVEEITLHTQWLEDRRKTLMTVNAAIIPWREQHQGKSHTEIVECPACQGKLRLSIAAHNGSVDGRCETAGCVSWKE